MSSAMGKHQQHKLTATTKSVTRQPALPTTTQTPTPVPKSKTLTPRPARSRKPAHTSNASNTSPAPPPKHYKTCTKSTTSVSVPKDLSLTDSTPYMSWAHYIASSTHHVKEQQQIASSIKLHQTYLNDLCARERISARLKRLTGKSSQQLLLNAATTSRIAGGRQRSNNSRQSVRSTINNFIKSNMNMAASTGTKSSYGPPTLICIGKRLELPPPNYNYEQTGVGGSGGVHELTRQREQKLANDIIVNMDHVVASKSYESNIKNLAARHRQSQPKLLKKAHKKTKTYVAPLQKQGEMLYPLLLRGVSRKIWKKIKPGLPLNITPYSASRATKNRASLNTANKSHSSSGNESISVVNQAFVQELFRGLL